MLEFSLKVEGAENLAFRLQTPIRDFSYVWPKVREWFAGAMRRQFESQGAAGVHGEWKANAESTAKRKLAEYGFEHTLVASGELYDSLAGESGNSVDERWPNKIRIGTSLPYAIVHQTGTSRAGRGNKTTIPQRRILDFSDADRKALERVFMGRIATMYRRAGFKVLGGGAGPGEARIAGKAFYQGLAESNAPLSAGFGEAFGPVSAGI